MKKMNKDKMNMILIAGATIISVAAGIAVSCIKNKMKMDSYCIIDEM